MPIAVANPSFESSTGWSNLDRESAELHAPPGGSSYAVRCLGCSGTSNNWLSQQVGTIEEGKRYTFSLWVRSVNADASLLPDGLTTGTARYTLAQIRMRAGTTVLGEASAEVSPKDLLGGAANTVASGDGVNIWFDDEYRFHAAERYTYQPLSSDPITDTWLDAGAAVEGMAKGPIHMSAGLKALYTTFYDDREDKFKSRIEKIDLQGAHFRLMGALWHVPIGIAPSDSH